MNNYHGFLSYPHGGRVSAFLLLSMACGVVCTCYAVSSCRFLTLDYNSVDGNFDQYFEQRDPDDKMINHRVGVGLFTWLRPYDTVDWSSGTCAGYNELQRDAIIDQLLDMLRVVSILAVMFAISLFLFALSVACLSLSNLLRYLMIGFALLVGIMTGSGFLMTRSALCTTIGTNPNCSVDQGGLVAVAGVIFWILTSLIATFFVQPAREKIPSKRNARKRKRELQERQLEMILQLEAQEVKKQMEAKQQQRLTNKGSPQRKQRYASPPSSPARSATSRTSSSSSFNTRSQKGSPENSPRNKRLTKRNDALNRKSVDPPCGSPERSPRQSQERSQNLVDQCEAQMPLQEEVEAIYQEMIRPTKKRRLRKESKRSKPVKTSALLDTDLGLNESPTRIKHRIQKKQKFKRSQREQKDFEVILESAERDDNSYSSLWSMLERGNDKLETSKAPNGKSPVAPARTIDDSYGLPLFSRDLSTVMNERKTNQNVEIISDALNKIDSMIDDDNSVIDHRFNYGYEI